MCVCMCVFYKIFARFWHKTLLFSLEYEETSVSLKCLRSKGVIPNIG